MVFIRRKLDIVRLLESALRGLYGGKSPSASTDGGVRRSQLPSLLRDFLGIEDLSKEYLDVELVRVVESVGDTSDVCQLRERLL